MGSGVKFPHDAVAVTDEPSPMCHWMIPGRRGCVMKPESEQLLSITLQGATMHGASVAGISCPSLFGMQELASLIIIERTKKSL